MRARIVEFADLPGTPCPCGTARRAFMDVPEFPASVHVTEIKVDAERHYHKRLTETYYFLEGTALATFDGERYELGPGDAAFAGVGCVHGFANAGRGPLRWLETQAPQPPARYSYRFTRDWTYLQDRLR